MFQQLFILLHILKTNKLILKVKGTLLIKTWLCPPINLRGSFCSCSQLPGSAATDKKSKLLIQTKLIKTMEKYIK